LRYHLYSPLPNGDGGLKVPFGVKTDSGVIFVRDALDYEERNVFFLEMVASDGKYNATASVRIFIEDVNDNAPVFEQPLYEVTVDEEERDLPKEFLRVIASDRDKVNIESCYSITIILLSL